MKMERYTIPKDKLAGFLSALSDYDVYAPHREDGRSLFLKVEDPSRVVLEKGNTTKPPKELVFPESERLLTFKTGDPPELKEQMPDIKPSVLFAVRNCDARAMMLVDKVFMEIDPVDPYYKARRDALTLIGLACNEPALNCFCTSVGGHPHGTEGLDAVFVELADKYLVEVITERGKAVVDKARSLLSPASDGDDSAREVLRRNVEGKLHRSIDTDGVPERLGKLFGSDYWDKVSATCIGCGVCTFHCPSCHCFDINDLARMKGGERVRCWDTCQFPEYTIHASSHNPRPAKKERQRQRFYHKYKYSMDNYGAFHCVGCGRCISQCPVQIDIIKVIEGTKEVAQ